jgi:hypothetical protein
MHYYAADLWSKGVDIQHFNVSSCQQLASSILMHLTTMQLIFGPRWIFNILMCPLANNWPPLNTMHLTTMQLIFGPKVDIQHFNVSSCQQLASSILCTTMQLIFWSKVDIQHFNIHLANNWPPLSTMPHYYAADLSQGGYSTFLMCPLANNWPPQYSLLCSDLWSKVDVQHFNVSSC